MAGQVTDLHPTAQACAAGTPDLDGSHPLSPERCFPAPSSGSQRHDRKFYVLPKAGNKLSVVVTNTKLPTAATVDERRTQWRTALNALAGRLAR